MSYDPMVDPSQPFSWFDYTTWGNNSSPFVKAGNVLFYGSNPSIPVPVPGAPQTQVQMTDGSWTPADANTSMWDKYHSDVQAWMNLIPNAAPTTSDYGKWILYGIGGLLVFMMLTESKGRRR